MYNPVGAIRVYEPQTILVSRTIDAARTRTPPLLAQYQTYTGGGAGAGGGGETQQLEKEQQTEKKNPKKKTILQ